MPTLRTALAAAATTAAALSLALPAANANPRDTARQMQSNTQARGIHQSMFAYAQSNRDWFPMMTGRGVVEDPGTNVGVFTELMENDFFTGEYALSPGESEAEPWTGRDDQGNDVPVTAGHLSYATLKLDPVGTVQDDLTPRNQTWRGDLNDQAIAVTDRNTAAPDAPASIWTTDRLPGWRGSVCWMDNHVTYEVPTEDAAPDDPTAPGDVVTTELVADKPVEADRLFAVDLAANADVLMTFDVFNGQEVRVPRRGR